MAKSDGRLQSLGILLAMIAVIGAFFLKFQRRADDPLVTPVPRAPATSRPAASSSSSPTVTPTAPDRSALPTASAAPSP
ncbi:MAG: hypothetical protein FJ095_09675 [Deltaproteobacteria bacterium]|nr:hypothetical protein [Deltaproteobacteria bacterium]